MFLCNPVHEGMLFVKVNISASFIVFGGASITLFLPKTTENVDVFT